MTSLLIVLIVFFAIFTESFVGFGLALVSMPLLAFIVDLKFAAPLVALVGLTAELILLMYYRAAINLNAVRRLVLASLVGIPAGVAVLKHVDEQIILPLLGVILTGYGLYALSMPRLPALSNSNWANGLGFVAGLLGGAYNTPSPPVIIYGTCRRWTPAEFKGNLQAFFVVNSVIVVVAHVIARNYTQAVVHDYLFTLPAIGLGALAGFALDRRIDADRFHKVVLIMLIVLGLTLIF
jgi:uncharacterized membrane protein YfcA